VQGPVGPAGPGAFKFSYFGAPVVNDPEHNVLPTGPFQLGIGCLPGTKAGDVGFKIYLTIPAPLEYTQTLESLTEAPPQTPPQISEGSQPAEGPVSETVNIESGQTKETWATIMLNNPATGASTWLEIWYGVSTGVGAHCFASGIEI
jgi:hypothetical protein